MNPSYNAGDPAHIPVHVGPKEVAQELSGGWRDSKGRGGGDSKGCGGGDSKGRGGGDSRPPLCLRAGSLHVKVPFPLLLGLEIHLLL